MPAPKLRHLNEDTSWLITIPDANENDFNILIDPWLSGPQTDFWTSFSTQWHATPSCVDNIADLGVPINAVVISHEWTDHCHKATLKQLPKSTPVLATEKAADLIRSWKYFDIVHTIKVLKPNQNWRSVVIDGLPESITISRIVSKEFDLANYHSAVCIAYQHGQNSVEGSAIIYTPHGISWSSLASLDGSSIANVTAILHGLHEVTNPKVFGGKLNLGGQNGVRAAQQCKARYWLSTHDEVKKAKGLISKVLKRRIWTVEEALKEEGLATIDAKFIHLSAGESIMLE